jgi:D-amino-acid dehydrogenase
MNVTSSRPTTVVIGSGVIGLACAAELVQRSHKVILVDPQAPGMGCSYGNAGCFSLASIVPVGMPGMWRKVPGWLADPTSPLSIPPRYLPRISSWLWQLHRASTSTSVERICDELRPLLADSLTAWRPLAAWAGASELIQQRGWAVVYESEDAYKADTYGWSLRRDRGIEIHVLKGHEITELEPALATRYTHMAYLPEQGQCLNPLRLSQSLANKLTIAGAQFVQAKATGFSFENGRVNAVMTDQGPLMADSVVVAAGAHSGKLAAALGSRVPLETERGYHAMVETTQTLLTRPVMSSEGKFFATPMEGGIRFAGSVELGGVEAPPNYGRADVLLKKGQTMLPDLDSGRVTRWMGLRPSMPDSKPVLGTAPGVSNAYFAFGHGHVGLTAAAPTALVIADLISGIEPKLNIKPFSPARFSR